MKDYIQIGRYVCRVYFNMPYNTYELMTHGPYIRKRGRTILRCTVSANLVEDGALDWHPIAVRQFDQAFESAYRFAPIMQRKIRRMVRRDS